MKINASTRIFPVDRCVNAYYLQIIETGDTDMTTHQTKTLNTIRAMNGAYVGFAADRTIQILISKGLITFSPTAYGAGYCRIKI